MIRVAIFDPRPVVCTGLRAVLAGDPELVHVGTAHDRYTLWPLVQRTHPDVFVVGHRPGAEGLQLTLGITQRSLAPRVVLYGTDLGTGAAVTAALAGASALVDAGAPERELLGAIRAAGGELPVSPAFSPGAQAGAAARLAPTDRAIFAMRLAGTPTADMAAVAGLRRSQLRSRLAAIVATLDGGGVSPLVHVSPAGWVSPPGRASLRAVA